MRKKDRSPLLCIISLSLLVVLLQGCQKRAVSISLTPTLITTRPTIVPIKTPIQSTPTASPTPTPSRTPTSIPEVWNYVAFGDESIIAEGELSYATHYASYMADDLGVIVNVEFYTMADVLVKDQIDHLRNDPELRNALSNASVITLATGDMDIIYPIIQSYLWDSCGGEDNEDCIREALIDFRLQYDALLDEILNLCRSGAVIRTMTLLTRSLHEIYGSDENLEPFYNLLNDHIIEASQAHDIPVAKVHELLKEAEASMANGYLNPAGWSPTEFGAQTIAELHRELGYEPTCP